MGDLQLRDPWFLLLSLLCIPVAWAMLRSKSSVAYSATSMFGDVPRTLRSRAIFLPPILTCAAIVLASIAIARPQTPDDTAKISREGVAIMLVIDHSGSMNARDLEEGFLNVNRLEVVKEVINYFVTGSSFDRSLDRLMTKRKTSNSRSGRPDDMLGLITFARYADSVCPLTLDHGNLLNTVDEISLATGNENRTAIGEGLGLAIERLRKSEIESKIVILLTDGVNNAGTLDPMKAGDLAASENVKVYCIGAGTNGYAPIPQTNPVTGVTSLRPEKVEIDEDSLKAISEKTGGKYFRATDKQSLKSIYDEIDQLERTEVSEFRYINFKEHYHGLAVAALVLAVLGSLLKVSLLRTAHD